VVRCSFIAGNLMLTFGQTQLFFLGLLVDRDRIGLLSPTAAPWSARLPEAGARRDAGFSAFTWASPGCAHRPILVGCFARCSG